MNLRQLTNDLVKWAKVNKDTIGYHQDFIYGWDVTVDKDGYIYTIEIMEAEERHVLAGANGRTVDDAVEQVASRLPAAFNSWGWPSEFPVKEK